MLYTIQKVFCNDYFLLWQHIQIEGKGRFISQESKQNPLFQAGLFAVFHTYMQYNCHLVDNKTLEKGVIYMECEIAFVIVY